MMEKILKMEDLGLNKTRDQFVTRFYLDNGKIIESVCTTDISVEKFGSPYWQEARLAADLSNLRKNNISKEEILRFFGDSNLPDGLFEMVKIMMQFYRD